MGAIVVEENEYEAKVRSWTRLSDGNRSRIAGLPSK